MPPAPARLAPALLTAALAACASAPERVSLYHDAGRNAPQTPAPRPDYPGYGAAAGKQAIPWSARSIADDFVELTFNGEWRSRRERLMRWERPVTVALAGPELNAYRRDMEELLAEIRAAAPALDIRLAPGEEPGDITVRTAPKEEMDAIAFGALCFFTPVDLDWEDFKAADARGEAGWDGVEALEKVTVFIPAYAAPNVYRICFAEEVMQALGPTNDLYRLEDSGFNDDEVHVAPTAFDLLVLGVLYDPALSPRMTREEARAAAEAVVRRRLGDRPGAAPRPASAEDDQFKSLYFAAEATDDDSLSNEMIDAALALAARFDPDDHRIGEARRLKAFALYRDDDLPGALAAIRAALAQFERSLPPDAPRLARTRSDYGFFLIEAGQDAAAIAALERAEPVLAANRMNAELANTIRLRAIALALAGRAGEARRAARAALDWSAFVFGAGSETVLRRRLQFASFGIDI